jgi:hypothetical protein
MAKHALLRWQAIVSATTTGFAASSKNLANLVPLRDHPPQDGASLGRLLDVLIGLGYLNLVN